MQSGFTGHVNPKEWRWVLVVSVVLVGLAFLPYLWILANDAPAIDWQFMGALHGHVEASAYLSRIRQGIEGDLLMQFLHTPEAHDSVILQPIYPLLGQISRLAADNLSPILVFHVARVSVTVFMYLALYQLAATIWMRVRTRRVFFALASVGSGFGWISLLISDGQLFGNLPLDLTWSQLSPFYSGLVSVHVPIAIACLALLSAIIIAALRPGVTSTPSVRNSGLVAFMLGIVLVLLYPDAYLLFAISLIITVVIQWYFAKHVTNREILWMMWVLIPALPFLIYYVLILRSNPFVQEWLQQRASHVVDPLQLLFAFGAILIVGLPAIWRAIRRFESDGDRYMLVWLFVAIIGALLPINLRAHFLVGIMLPLAYFATRAIEDVWLKNISRQGRLTVFTVFIVLVMISNLVVLLLPIVPLSSQPLRSSAGLVLASEYGVAFDWLDDRSTDLDVILASPDVSTWIPLWLGAHAVAGHPNETMASASKSHYIREFYQLESLDECIPMLSGATGFVGRYSVDFILFGPSELQIGDGNCRHRLTFVASFGDVEIYQVPTTFPR